VLPLFAFINLNLYLLIHRNVHEKEKRKWMETAGDLEGRTQREKPPTLPVRRRNVMDEDKLEAEKGSITLI